MHYKQFINAIIALNICTTIYICVYICYLSGIAGFLDIFDTVVIDNPKEFSSILKWQTENLNRINGNKNIT